MCRRRRQDLRTGIGFQHQGLGPTPGAAVQTEPHPTGEGPLQRPPRIGPGQSHLAGPHRLARRRPQGGGAQDGGAIEIFSADLSARDRKRIGYNDDSFNDKWKRLPRNKPSHTIVAHLQKDGYMFIHPTQDRTISVREAARLQSFPDSFVFCGGRGSQFRQVGNAVPPLLARAVGKTVLRILQS